MGAAQLGASESILAGAMISRGLRSSSTLISTGRPIAEVERLESEYRRQKLLYDHDVISAREYEVTQTALDMAKAKLREDQERFKLLVEGPRKEQIEQARAALRQGHEQKLVAVGRGCRRVLADAENTRSAQVYGVIWDVSTEGADARIASA